MEWIDVNERLPETGKYVLARHSRGTWSDSSDQQNVNCVVVKIARGISMNERELMEKGILASEPQTGITYDGSWDKPIYHVNERFKVYKAEDEHGNNHRPYNWRTFGATSFFGQEISHWVPLPEPPIQ